jgi:hypothetical protein
VIIKLPNVSEPQKDAIKANLDFGFRTAKAALNYGILNVPAFLDSVGQKDFRNILENSIDYNKTIPTLAVSAAIKLGFSTAQMLLSAGAVLEQDMS